ncbi:MAG: GntR family transcriptional regulator [Betaproteobacteria bacterium]|nr:GntR family transcriptional regulator [Betaproteobacteria bacterium]
MPRKAKKPTLALTDQARALLEELIVTLELPPGSVWSEAQLSERLGIGRTPVREALQRLQSVYLVKIVPRFGAQITQINVSEHLRLLEVRRVLERLIAVSAARRATPDESAQLLRMAITLEAMVDTDVLKYLRFHYEIKSFIAACARNPYAASAIAPAYAISRRFYYLHYRKAHDLPVATAHHARVIRAIVAGDEAKAAAASDRLMDYVDELTRTTVTQDR